MIQIRKNVFETNSSSTHSLVISKKERSYDYSLPVDDDGTLTITFGEFGWGPELLITPIEKLSYLVTDRGGLYDIPEELKNADDNAIYDFIMEESEAIKDIVEVVKNCCPEVKEVRFELGDSWNPFGYVDHQSHGTSYGVDLSIEDLIFSNKVVIMIDNDNSCHYEEYFTDWQGNPPTKDIEDIFNS